MASVKYEDKFYFPSGHVWVLMDDEWGVEICGEEGKGGAITGMDSWEFTNRDAWLQCGEICSNYLRSLSEKVNSKEITEQVAFEQYNLFYRNIDEHPYLAPYIKEEA